MSIVCAMNRKSEDISRSRNKDKSKRSLIVLVLLLAMLASCTERRPVTFEAEPSRERTETSAPAPESVSYIKHYPWGSVRITETADGIVIDPVD